MDARVALEVGVDLDACRHAVVELDGAAQGGAAELILTPLLGGDLDGQFAVLDLKGRLCRNLRFEFLEIDRDRLPVGSDRGGGASLRAASAERGDFEDARAQRS